MSSAANKSQKNSPRPSNKQVGHVNDFHSDILFSFSKKEIDAIIGHGRPYKTAFRQMVRDFFAKFIGIVVMVAKVVNREQSPHDLVNATGRKQYVIAEVAATIPRGAPIGVADNAPMEFFRLDLSERGGWISDEDLEKEFESRELVADPAYQFTINQENPEFADQYRNALHWKDANGKWCFAAFGRDGDERYVYVVRGARDWDDDWWFAGRRKLPLDA